MRPVAGEKLPSNIADVCVVRKIAARDLSEDSWHGDGGGAEDRLHHSRKE